MYVYVFLKKPKLTLILTVKIFQADCAIGTEVDAKLAREVVGLLLMSLKEYYEAKGSAETVVVSSFFSVFLL